MRKDTLQALLAYGCEEWARSWKDCKRKFLLDTFNYKEVIFAFLPLLNSERSGITRAQGKLCAFLFEDHFLNVHLPRQRKPRFGASVQHDSSERSLLPHLTNLLARRRLLDSNLQISDLGAS